jgi:hypothetical protein
MRSEGSRAVSCFCLSRIRWLASALVALVLAMNASASEPSCKAADALSGDLLTFYKSLNSEAVASGYYRQLKSGSGQHQHCEVKIDPDFGSSKLIFKFKDGAEFEMSSDSDGGRVSRVRPAKPLAVNAAMVFLEKALKQVKLCSINWDKPVVHDREQRYLCFAKGKIHELGFAYLEKTPGGQVSALGDALDGLADGE